MRPIVVLLVVVCAVAGCGASSTTVPASAVALVGGRPVPLAAVDAQLAQARRAYRARGQVFPARGTLAYAHLQALAVQLVVERAQVDRRLRQVKRATFGGSERRYQEGLRREGLTDADIRADIRSQLLADAVKRVMGDTLIPKVVYAKGFAPGPAV